MDLIDSCKNDDLVGYQVLFVIWSWTIPHFVDDHYYFNHVDEYSHPDNLNTGTFNICYIIEMYRNDSFLYSNEQ